MEPLFFKAENTSTWATVFVDGQASMEPLFFKAENALLAEQMRLAGYTASMEPLFFKAENGLVVA